MFWLLEGMFMGLFLMGLVLKNPFLIVIGALAALGLPFVLMPQ